MKVYNAYKRAMQHNGQPTVILAKTVKGYGLGRDSRRPHDRAPDRRRLAMPICSRFATASSSRSPTKRSTTSTFSARLRIRRRCATAPAHRGARRTAADARGEAHRDQGSRARNFQGCARKARAAARRRPPRPSSPCIKSLLKSPELGKLVVPIIPDEARTFGMESLFREYGIYASQGQHYKPVDSNVLLYYKEAQNGQILEEGITEAGSMASCLAAGTAYANYGVPMIPFYIYYSMFGFQRVGDLVWAFADSRGKGFLMGGTSGRTTLLGEGLQHQDGHSPLLFSVVPTCAIYDPAYAYELAVIIQDGIRRMYQEMEDAFLLHLRLQRKLRAAADARHRDGVSPNCAREF